VSASYRNAGCKTFTPLFYGTVNQLLINLVPFIRDALQLVMASVDVSAWGRTNLHFVDPGIKINGQYRPGV